MQSFHLVPYDHENEMYNLEDYDLDAIEQEIYEYIYSILPGENDHYVQVSRRYFDSPLKEGEGSVTFDVEYEENWQLDETKGTTELKKVMFWTYNGYGPDARQFLLTSDDRFKLYY